MVACLFTSISLEPKWLRVTWIIPCECLAFQVVGMVMGTSTVALLPLPIPYGSDGDPTPRGVGFRLSPNLAALQLLMFHEETTTLEKVFTLLGFKKHGLSFNELADALEAYLIHWLVGELAGHHTMRGLPVSVLRHGILGWDDISHFVRGKISRGTASL